MAGDFDSHELDPRGKAADTAGVSVTPAERPDYPRVEPPGSRFLFVDVAALRAKQLRRGARPRLDPATIPAPAAPIPRKLERIAMEEVRHGLIPYQLPLHGSDGEGPA